MLFYSLWVLDCAYFWYYNCVNSVNETVNYYINNSGKVYVCTLDAS